jgi:hypothetical protein
MKRQKLLIGSIIVVSLLLVGTLVAFLMATELGKVERRNVLLSKSLIVQGNDYEYILVNVTVKGYSDDFLASFTVSDGETIKFSPFPDIIYLSMWQEGTFNTSWFEGNQLDYGIGYRSGIPDTSFSAVFVFVNEDSYAKEVHFRFFRVWQERNYPVMIAGIGMMAIGVGMGGRLKLNKLQIGYLICLYITGFWMMLFFVDFIWSFGHVGVLHMVLSLQGTMLFASLALGVLAYLWLEKDNGLTYLESWNMGKKLRIVGFLLFGGALLNIALLTIDALTLWNFSSTRVEIEYGFSSVPNPLYLGLFGIASTMMLSGIFAFTSLWLRKSKLLT